MTNKPLHKLLFVDVTEMRETVEQVFRNGKDNT